ncbi:lysylphosphatidylglycerol synthase transmembrane domain-containing protein [Leptolyngbya sp. 7M]|uniref:lysylphosphatidylglycerol synthase transmembrane domain-containing protein n=1 Tax=Leptolyngbya sp. 7M TaxID=2812896 RepID=UPI001B8B4945|nr:lysylphosphatidylglycerol synthase transmembrane domain-containing protein [Leptolyngbya sp. 7M]QYO68377.1 flippase-like domain-containing protein [Leptolyngbya sp. 7M]
MNPGTPITQAAEFAPKPSRKARNLKFIGIFLTICGIGLFAYLVYSVGIAEIAGNIGRFGILGFLVILSIYAVRVCLRAATWKLSVYEPYRLKMRDTIPAVMIGEAMSSTIPLGIVVSGTAKAVAVRRKVPLVVGLSSVATENLFYSFTTTVFLISGAFVFARWFAPDPNTVLLIDILIGLMIGTLVFLALLIIRQWHFASEFCEWLYRRGLLTSILDTGRVQVRLFENLIYGFYRRHPDRFIPIVLMEIAFHFLGIVEVWFILTRIAEPASHMVNAFLLESVSRLITIVFKLVPFLIGVDEAGAQFVGEAVGIGAAIAVTLAIIRKGRILFWSALGWLLIVNRGLGIRRIFHGRSSLGTHTNIGQDR